MNKILRLFAIVSAAAAIACAVVLLTSDTSLALPPWISRPEISAAPLFFIGFSLLILQAIRRPRWSELLKSLLLAAAFLLWGVVQLMPTSPLSRFLGHVVIALYVLDLAWVILATLNPASIRASPPPSDVQDPALGKILD
jgi:peptidoglycan/LPS O-acetylase OafA/YrhL